jgi:phage baseplate assembly protein W
MASLSVKLPLERSGEDGFEMIKNFKVLIKQNFKMLLLTDPGERVMEPSFGIGLKQYLFENFGESTFTKIERKIVQQARIYIPVLNIQEIEFAPVPSNPNALNIRIKYSIPNLNIKDLLEFTI